MIPFSLFNFRYQLENSEINLFGGFSHIWVIWWVKIGSNWGKMGKNSFKTGLDVQK